MHNPPGLYTSTDLNLKQRPSSAARQNRRLTFLRIRRPCRNLVYCRSQRRHHLLLPTRHEAALRPLHTVRD